RAGLAMPADPTDLGTQPVVPRAGPPWRADAQDDHRRLGAQAPHRPVALHHRGCCYRGGGDEGSAGDDLTPSAGPDQSCRIQVAEPKWPLASTADRKNGPGLLSPTRRTRDVGAAATSGPYVSLIWCSTQSGHGNGLRPWIRNNN